jgi:hypothetical protein
MVWWRPAGRSGSTGVGFLGRRPAGIGREEESFGFGERGKMGGKTNSTTRAFATTFLCVFSFRCGLYRCFWIIFL